MKHLSIMVLAFVAAPSVVNSSDAAPSKLQPLLALVEEVTKGLPSRFGDDPELKSFNNLDGPMPKEALRYARFYWTLDSIEGECEYLGQRTNIEMLDPGLSVTVRAGLPFSDPSHPDREAYMAIYGLVSNTIEEVGEEDACAEMYRLLGPNGALMEEAVKINGLIDPEMLEKYAVTTEDGVMWSKRDYCEREFHLQPPADRDWHDAICKKAKEQPF